MTAFRQRRDHPANDDRQDSVQECVRRGTQETAEPSQFLTGSAGSYCVIAEGTSLVLALRQSHEEIDRRSRMERKQFEVRSARNAEFFRCDCPWAAISISTLGDFPVLSEGNRVGLLRLVFADTLEPGKPDSFTQSLAVEILDFVEQMWDQAEVFLIHCEAGLSRSPAVASALSRIYYNDDGPWFELDFPNGLVRRLLIEANLRKQSTTDSSDTEGR